MAMTDKQRRARAGKIGSSTAPKIIGVCPWGDALDAYREIVDGAFKDETAAMTEGKFFEPAILDWAAWKLEKTFSRDEMVVDSRYDFICANFDGIQLPIGEDKGDFVVEAKRIRSEFADQGWGRAGTDQIPQHVLVQVCHQLYVAGPHYKIAYVAADRPNGMGLYKVKRDEELIGAIVAAETKFYRGHVEPRIPPLRAEKEA